MEIESPEDSSGTRGGLASEIAKCGSEMHVCHIINNLEVGGAETMLLKLLGRVRQSGIESSVIALIGKGTVGPQIEQMGIPVDCLGMRQLSALRFEPTGVVQKTGLLGILREY